MRAAAIPLVLLAFGGVARAERTGRVVGHVKVVVDGAERADASGVVVYLTGFTEPPPRDAVRPTMVQRDRRFDPALIAITAGQEVSFPNADPFFHNVFSVSPAQRFDLGQYKLGETEKTL
jgi:plastocyanin